MDEQRDAQLRAANNEPILINHKVLQEVLVCEGQNDANVDILLQKYVSKHGFVLLCHVYLRFVLSQSLNYELGDHVNCDDDETATVRFKLFKTVVTKPNATEVCIRAELFERDNVTRT